MTEVFVEFPLSGEWYVGADGTEESHLFAFDFMCLDQKLKATPRAAWRELFQAIPLAEYYGWGRPILSPFAGRVVTALDGCTEGEQSYLIAMLSALRSALSRQEKERINQLKYDKNGDIRSFAGNYLVIESTETPGLFAFIAHARHGSTLVKAGDHVTALQAIAQVGQSGQSMLPHLHFHLMSDPNPLAEKLIPLKFKHYEVKIAGEWLSQENAAPIRKQRIRSIHLENR
jgi:murein DD-endopeptidase MepM/ murein hydrolase activator NlpD